MPAPHPIVVRLAEQRRAAGITQVRLARRLHVRQGTVSGWETGHHQPDLAQLYAYAEQVGLRILLVPAANPALHLREESAA